MRETGRHSGEEERPDIESERERTLDSKEQEVFNDASKEDEIKGLEVRTQREIAAEVAEVKQQIDLAFEQVERNQEKFGDWVRANPELTASLSRFLEFLIKLKQEEVKQ